MLYWNKSLSMILGIILGSLLIQAQENTSDSGTSTLTPNEDGVYDFEGYISDTGPVDIYDVLDGATFEDETSATEGMEAAQSGLDMIASGSEAIKGAVGTQDDYSISADASLSDLNSMLADRIASKTANAEAVTAAVTAEIESQRVDPETGEPVSEEEAFADAADKYGYNPDGTRKDGQEGPIYQEGELTFDLTGVQDRGKTVSAQTLPDEIVSAEDYMDSNSKPTARGMTMEMIQETYGNVDPTDTTWGLPEEDDSMDLPENVAAGEDQIPIDRIDVVALPASKGASPDYQTVLSWPITFTLSSVTTQNGNYGHTYIGPGNANYVKYSPPIGNHWKPALFTFSPTPKISALIWIVLPKHDGTNRWWAQTFEWTGPHHDFFFLSNVVDMVTSVLWGPLSTAAYSPRTGDTVGFFISTPRARHPNLIMNYAEVGEVRERTNIVTTTWPDFNYNDPEVPAEDLHDPIYDAALEELNSVFGGTGSQASDFENMPEDPFNTGG